MFDLLANNDMVNTMDKAMTVASRRMALVASNLANIDTPFYRAQDLPFHETLIKALEDEDVGHPLHLVRTHPMHILGHDCRTSLLFSDTDKANSAYERNDFNDVNLDKENMKVMQTQGTYIQASTFTQSALKRVFYAVREGAK
jgi:flagellar basal-body rod protein FlgB